MVIIFLLSIIFAAIIGLMVYRGRSVAGGYVSSDYQVRFRSAPARPDHRPATQRKDYRAVSIECDKTACEAAKRMVGKRGFPTQIPQLPVSQCDAESCSCRYRNHDDRRSPLDRRAEIMYVTTVNWVEDSVKERRTANDRRAENKIREVDESGMEQFNFHSSTL